MVIKEIKDSIGSCLDEGLVVHVHEVIGIRKKIDRYDGVVL